MNENIEKAISLYSNTEKSVKVEKYYIFYIQLLIIKQD